MNSSIDGVASVDLRQAATDLSAAIAALPEGLEGHLESLDEPLSRLRDALNAGAKENGNG
jgi:hypothetical protein